ncbi:MAG: DUF3465 domain-containing protein [Candidatus Eremiobacteraeota bacterium]|nr:DUF3465 domain-containing protein [Candidatus Eremiobacteraeota bacterium]
MELASAIAGGRRAEVDFSGTVSSSPTFFYGTRTHCEHEQFNVSTSCGAIQIIDNVDLAPRIPVQPGDRVDVRGEYVSDPGKGPIVHWTHHDPSGKHPDGFIRLHGQVYA